MVGQVAEFGWADEGEVGRVEHHDRPFAFEVIAANGYKFTVVRRGCFEWNDFCVD